MKSFSNPLPLLLQHIPADCEPLPVQDRTDISSHSHITDHPLFSWHIEACLLYTSKDIWICGGADIIQPLIEQNIIDTYHISVIPIILGSGIPLFQGRKTILKLKLAASKSYNGITDLIYKRR